MKIRVKVKSNARINEVKEIEPGYFDIRVNVPPEKGKANQKVIELIAKHIKVAKSKVRIISGESFKEKILEIDE